MALKTIFSALYVGAEALVQKADMAVIKIMNDVDIEALLQGEGAAGSGGSLEGARDFVVDYGRGANTIMRDLGWLIGALVLGGFALGLALKSGNSQEVSNKKSQAPVLVIALIVFAAITSLLVFFQKIGSNLL